LKRVYRASFLLAAALLSRGAAGQVDAGQPAAGQRLAPTAAEQQPAAPPASLPPPAGEALIAAPLLVQFQAADYPGPALFGGREAEVACALDVDEQGAVTAARCDETGDLLFARPARDALRLARFKPATINGRASTSSTRFVYRFAVSRESLGEPPAFVAAATVRGVINASGTNKPLAGADLLVEGLGLATTTDAQGHYSIELPLGSHVLVADSPLFSRGQVRVEVLPGQPQIDADAHYLRRRAVSNDFSATAIAERTRIAPTKDTVIREELRNVPGSQNDPLRVIENLPGLARVPFTGGQLIVRGAPAQDTGAYIDGQRIPVLYHLLNGPSVLGEEMVDKIDFYPGGAGAYFGRSMGGVVQIQSRRGDPERYHGSLAADLNKSAAFLQGPIGSDTQFAVGARKSYVNPVVKFFVDPNKEITLPIYYDYQGRVDTRLSQADRLSLLFYGSNDSFQQVGGGRGSVPIDLGRELGFHRIRLTLFHRLSDDLSLEVAPAIGWDLSTSNSSGTGPGVFERSQSSSEHTISSGGRAELIYRLGSLGEVRAGLDILFNRVSYSLDQLFAQQLRNLGAPNAEERKLSGLRTLGSFGETIESELHLGQLRLTPGLRIEELHWPGRTYLVGDPRIWARYALNQATTLHAYAGLYHQEPTAEQIDPTIGNPQLLPQVAQQFGVGVERSFGELWSVKAETYLNRRRSLVYAAQARANGDGTYDNPLQLNSGIGHSLGLEVLIRRNFTERLYGWIAYTLSRSREDPNSDLPGLGRAFIPTLYDQPHILTFLVGFRPSPYVEFSTRVRFASGNPISQATGATFDADSGNYLPSLLPFGSKRLPAFVQVDFELNNIWVADKYQIQLYVDLQNLLDRGNPEAVVYDFRYQSQDFVHGVPFLASVGAKVSF